MENDNRLAYDELKNIKSNATANLDIKKILNDIIVNDIQTIRLDSVLSWKVGVEPLKFNLDNLRAIYNDSIAQLDSPTRLSLARYIIGREDIFIWDRMDFAVWVISKDPSLRFVAAALQSLSTMADYKTMKGDIDSTIAWWKENNAFILGP